MSDVEALKKKLLQRKLKERKSAMVDSIFEEDLKPRAPRDITQDMSGMEKFTAGAGQGFANVLRRGGNLLGLVDQEEIDTAKRADKELLDTGAGAAGAFAGEMGALAPLGAVGGAVKGATGLYKGGSLLGRSLAAVAPAAAEGAAVGALMADEGERGAGALQGGAFSAGATGALKGLGKLGKGVVSKSQVGRRMEQELGEQLPLGMTADPNTLTGKFTQWIYRDAMPYLPLSGKNAKQFEDATEKMMKNLAESSTPTGFKGVQGGERALRDWVDASAQAFSNGYKAIFRNNKGEPMQFLVRELGDVSDEASEIIAKYSGTKSISGTDLMRAREALLKEAARAVGSTGRLLKEDLILAAKELDNLVATRLKKGAGARNLMRLKKYEQLIGKDMEFKQMEEAIRGAVGGAVTPRTAGDSARKGAKVLGKSTALLDRAEDVEALYGKGLPPTPAWAKVAAFIGSIGTGGGLLTVNPALSSKVVQRALTGDTAIQQAGKRAAQNPYLMESLRSARRGMTAQTQDEDY